MKKSLANVALLILEKTIDGYVRLEDFAYNPGFYAYSGGWDYSLKKSELAQVLKRLRKRGLIEIDNKDQNKILLKLTEVGREFILLSKSEDEIEWDGKWRIVIFDIPEDKRKIRNVFRSRLKLWDFKPWQKSVWASKKNVTSKLRNLIKELEIDNWVLVIESDNTGR